MGKVYKYKLYGNSNENVVVWLSDQLVGLDWLNGSRERQLILVEEEDERSYCMVAVFFKLWLMSSWKVFLTLFYEEGGIALYSTQMVEQSKLLENYI